MAGDYKPLLIFPSPASAPRHRRGGGPTAINFPGPKQQADRLAPRFNALTEAVASQRVRLQRSPDGHDVDKVIVFEMVDTGDESIIREIEQVLVDYIARDTDDIEPDDQFFNIHDANKRLRGHIYVTFSSLRATNELLSLWRIYQTNPEHPQFDSSRAHWGRVFRYLKDVRVWGPLDRIRETGLELLWRERVDAGAEQVSVEIELWYRRNSSVRWCAEDDLRALVSEAGGRWHASTCVEEIEYHAISAELPIKAVQCILEARNVRLIQSDWVMSFRPLGQSLIRIAEDDVTEALSDTGDPAPVQHYRDPVVALLDGLPIENHKRLVGKIVVDDPDGWANEYPVQERHHGTAMASIIVNGDLSAGEVPLDRPIYVRPILRPRDGDWRRPRPEYIPDNVLPVDLLHRAVRRFFGTEGGQQPVAPGVRVVNLSVGDPVRPFHMYPSPWARMIDYLSWRYNLLFVISAGNHGADFSVARSWLDNPSDGSSRLQRPALAAVREHFRSRRILSPAEAINAITVGSINDDASPWLPEQGEVMPIESVDLPSLFSAVGAGFRRSVKPDILLAGGRQTYRCLPDGDGGLILRANMTGRLPGHQVAAPGETPGDTNRVRYSRGTSNAAALATRAVARIHEALERLRATEPHGHRIERRHEAVLLKALLVHGAGWGMSRKILLEHLPDIDKGDLVRWLGYGRVDVTRTLACEEHRVTLLGFSELVDGHAHVYSLPLPPGLAGKRTWRRLTVTLAWLTPIKPWHQCYRRADLWFDIFQKSDADGRAVQKSGNAATLLGVDRRDVDWQTVRRGTVQHEVFEGDIATSFDDGEAVKIQVNCREVRGPLDVNIPYGLAVTLEIAEGVDIPIYSQIRERVGIKTG